ncbi:MAG: hypothetical protein AAFQ94_25460 [Bacteroidota bacterium]
MSKTDFENQLAIIMAIPGVEIRKPDIPIDVFLQEAENLNLVAGQDQAALVGAGLKWEKFGASLEEKAGALRYAQSNWITTRYSQEEAERQWDERSGVAYELKDDLIADYRFAFRYREDLLSRLSEVVSGTSHADMIQDLSDLAALGKIGQEELAAINFNESKLVEAETMADELGIVLAKANEQGEKSEAKLIRDKAFTLLREAVDEIRITGKYVFRKDKERQKAYTSPYNRQKG